MSADKFPVAITGAGNQLIIAAPSGPGAYIRVVSYHLTAPAAAVVTHATLTSGGYVACTDYVGAGDQAGGYCDPGGIFDLPPNTAYYIVTGATVGGCVRAQVMGAG